MSELRAHINMTLSRLSKAMSRSEAASIAGKASAAKRKANAGGQTTDINAATDKAKRLIAANPGKYGPKGAKKKAGAKPKAAKDPAAVKAKAEKDAQSKAEHEQRQKEHADDRAQRQADHEQRAKEHAQDRTQRQQDREARLKQQAAKAKTKSSGGGSKKSGNAKSQAHADKQQAQAELSSAANALATGGQMTADQMQSLVTNGLAKPRAAGGIELTPAGRSAAKRPPPPQPGGAITMHKAQIADVLTRTGFGDLAKAIGSIEQQRAMFASMGSGGGKGGPSKIWPRGKNGKRSPHAGPKSGGGGGGEISHVDPATAPTGHPSRSRAYSPDALAAHASKGDQSVLGFEHENGARVMVLTNSNKKGTPVKGTHQVTIWQPSGQSSSLQSNTKSLKTLGQQMKDKGMIYVSPQHNLDGSDTAKMAKAFTPVSAWHGWAAITKVDEEKRIVYGVASSELPDNEPGIWKGESYQGDIISSDAMRQAAPAYLQFPAIREMHQPSAAGTAVHFEVNGAETLIGALIVDDQAWAKVVNKVYRGFSIGGKCKDAEIIKIEGRPFRKVTALELTEISLVDRPRNPDAKITLFKGADMEPEQDATEVAEGTIAKAADPTKAIALLQQLRNDAETGGDMDAADDYTAAIRSVAQAAGIATAAADDEDADPADDDSALALDDGSDPADDMAMAASVADLRKAYPALSDEGLIGLLLTGTARSASAITKRGAALSSSNLAHAKTAHDALQKMTGGAVCAPNGQPNAIAMAETLAPHDLAKALSPAFDGIAKVLEQNGVAIEGLAKRLEHLESQPAPGGPVVRAVEKVLPGGDLGAGTVPSEEIELNALRKVRDNATDDITRKHIADEITKRELRAVYRGTSA